MLADLSFLVVVLLLEDWSFEEVQLWTFFFYWQHFFLGCSNEKKKLMLLIRTISLSFFEPNFAWKYELNDTSWRIKSILIF